MLDGVFVVTGRHGVGPFIATRNMTVLRQGGALTIVNSVRLDDEGERALAALGTVKNLVRLGWFHGLDDPYYMERWRPRFFSPARMVPVNVDEGLRTDLAEGATEFGACFRFSAGDYDEAALLLESGALVTCDSVQNHVDTKGFSLLGNAMLRVAGLVGGVRVGTVWARKMTGGAPRLLAGDFARLTALPFRHLLPGHGAPLLDGAHAAVAAAVARQLR